MKKENRIFKKIVTLWFYIGVNIVGIPEIAEHRLALYKYNPICN